MKGWACKILESEKTGSCKLVPQATSKDRAQALVGQDRDGHPGCCSIQKQELAPRQHQFTAAPSPGTLGQAKASRLDPR